MIYAAKTRAADHAITVGAYTNRPLIPILAFDSVAAYRSELDRIWEGADGPNLIRVPRRQVEGWFGRDFAVTACGQVRERLMEESQPCMCLVCDPTTASVD